MMEYRYNGELPVNVSELKERGIIDDSTIIYKGKSVTIDDKYKNLIMAMDACPLFTRL